MAEFQLDEFVLGIIVFSLKILSMFDSLYKAFMKFVNVKYKFFWDMSRK